LPTPRCRENPVGKFKALIGKAFRRPFSDTCVSKNASRVGKPPHAGRGMAKEKADAV
jgi:hypothetical protein